VFNGKMTQCLGVLLGYSIPEINKCENVHLQVDGSLKFETVKADHDS
jgi:hypothetical protein